MDTFQKSIIAMMKSAITSTPEALPDDLQLEAVEAFAKQQSIVPLVYTGAVTCGISPQNPVMKRMFQEYLRMMLHSSRQMQAVDVLFDAFSKHGIDYLPLKGCNAKRLYPKPELRFMTDADILIRVNQYDAIVPVMQELGYTPCEVSDYEYPWQGKSLYVELHDKLIPSCNKDYYSYFRDGWHMAQPVEGSQFALSAENDFLFQFTHFAKHYREGGIGCRYVLDLWIYRRANPGLNEDFLRKELGRLRLLEFYENIMQLIRGWFEEGPMDEKLDYLTEVIFSGDSWGVWEKKALAMGIRNLDSNASPIIRSVKLLLRKVFPPISALKKNYPAAEKYPLLLPFIWIIRLATILLFKRQKIQTTQTMLRESTDEKMQDYHQSLSYVGLDFPEA